VRGAVSLDGGGDGNGEHERGNDPPADAPGPLQVADRNETQQLVQDGINSLDDEQRMVVILRDIEGYDYEEIARMLDCPRGTVKSRLHRARLVLRERLRPLFQPEEERT
jgi:RNA polymerase sigma-70 factor (ECF subfamily)